MKTRFLLPSFLTACLGLLAASGSAHAQIWGYGGYGGYGGGLFDPLYGGLYGGYNYGGLNPYSNAGRSFSNPGFGFRNTPASSGGSFGWSPYAEPRRSELYTRSEASRRSHSASGFFSGRRISATSLRPPPL